MHNSSGLRKEHFGWEKLYFQLKLWFLTNLDQVVEMLKPNQTTSEAKTQIQNSNKTRIRTTSPHPIHHMDNLKMHFQAFRDRHACCFRNTLMWNLMAPTNGGCSCSACWHFIYFCWLSRTWSFIQTCNTVSTLFIITFCAGYNQRLKKIVRAQFVLFFFPCCTRSMLQSVTQSHLKNPLRGGKLFLWQSWRDALWLYFTMQLGLCPAKSINKSIACVQC